MNTMPTPAPMSEPPQSEVNAGLNMLDRNCDALSKDIEILAHTLIPVMKPDPAIIGDNQASCDPKSPAVCIVRQKIDLLNEAVLRMSRQVNDLISRSAV